MSKIVPPRGPTLIFSCGSACPWFGYSLPDRSDAYCRNVGKDISGYNIESEGFPDLCPLEDAK